MIDTKRILKAPTYKTFKECVTKAEEIANGARLGRPQEILDYLATANQTWLAFKGFLEIEFKGTQYEYILRGSVTMVTELISMFGLWVKGEETIRLSEVELNLDHLLDWVCELETDLKIVNERERKST